MQRASPLLSMLAAFALVACATSRVELDGAPVALAEVGSLAIVVGEPDSTLARSRFLRRVVTDVVVDHFRDRGIQQLDAIASLAHQTEAAYAIVVDGDRLGASVTATAVLARRGPEGSWTPLARAEATEDELSRFEQLFAASDPEALAIDGTRARGISDAYSRTVRAAADALFVGSAASRPATRGGESQGVASASANEAADPIADMSKDQLSACLDGGDEFILRGLRICTRGCANEEECKAQCRPILESLGIDERCVDLAQARQLYLARQGHSDSGFPRSHPLARQVMCVETASRMYEACRPCEAQRDCELCVELTAAQREVPRMFDECLEILRDQQLLIRRGVLSSGVALRSEQRSRVH